MAAGISQLNLARASDSVFQILREGILARTFRPGERLNVHDLAARLGVSLTPVKDAINRLAAEGLIEIKPRSGTFVTAISPSDVAETFEIRAALECLAAERMLARITEEDVGRFAKLAADLEKPVTTKKQRTFHEVKNIEFHALIVELSGNRKLIEMYRNLNAHIQIARIHDTRREWTARMEQERREHREIFAAIKARDRQRLVETLNGHIKRAARALVGDLRSGEHENGQPAA